MDVLKNKIITKIKSKRRGWVFCAKDLSGISTRNTIDKNLSRLADDDFIIRLTRGIYYYPITQKDIGVIPPNIDDVARAVAQSLGVSIFPSGAYCANALGFSNQVPAQNIYLTNGRSFKKQIGNNVIYFKHTKINPAPNISKKAVFLLHALNHLGKSNIDDDILRRCSLLLNNLDKKHLLKMSNHLSSWVLDIIHQLNTFKNPNAEIH